jgi:hypothetical protein
MSRPSSGKRVVQAREFRLLIELDPLLELPLEGAAELKVPVDAEPLLELLEVL